MRRPLPCRHPRWLRPSSFRQRAEGLPFLPLRPDRRSPRRLRPHRERAHHHHGEGGPGWGRANSPRPRARPRFPSGIDAYELLVRAPSGDLSRASESGGKCSVARSRPATAIFHSRWGRLDRNTDGSERRFGPGPKLPSELDRAFGASKTSRLRLTLRACGPASPARPPRSHPLVPPEPATNPPEPIAFPPEPDASSPSEPSSVFGGEPSAPSSSPPGPVGIPSPSSGAGRVGRSSTGDNKQPVETRHAGSAIHVHRTFTCSQYHEAGNARITKRGHHLHTFLAVEIRLPGKSRGRKPLISGIHAATSWHTLAQPGSKCPAALLL